MKRKKYKFIFSAGGHCLGYQEVPQWKGRLAIPFALITLVGALICVGYLCATTNVNIGKPASIEVPFLAR